MNLLYYNLLPWLFCWTFLFFFGYIFFFYNTLNHYLNFFCSSLVLEFCTSCFSSKDFNSFKNQKKVFLFFKLILIDIALGRNSNKLETSKLKLYNKAFAKGIDNIRIVLGKVSWKTFYPSKPFPLFIQYISLEERVVYHLNDL